MKKLSIIIPARHELYLQQTIDDLLKKASGEIEIITILDGYWPDPILKDDPRLIVIHREKHGMRSSINAGVAVAKGDYIMKIDAHCMFSEGYDEVLKAECDKDWVVIPRRYSLEVDADPWTVRWHRPFVDYEYLSWPWHPGIKVFGIVGAVWDARIEDRINFLLDENLTFQGSCWFTPKEFFLNRIGKLDDEGYGTFIGEAQEIGLKVWLGGGKVMTNKKVWYGHLWKGQPYREKYKARYGVPYTRIGPTEFKNGNKYSVDYWLNNRWEKHIHTIEWLIDKFWPIPTWPEKRGEWTHSSIS